MTNLKHIMENPELVKKLIMGKLAIKKGEVGICDSILLNGEKIEGTTCCKCDFYNHDISCMIQRQKYLEAEYKPVPKLTKKEKAFLDAIRIKTAYICRAYNNELYVYSDIPVKKEFGWVLQTSGYSYLISNYFFGNLFQFITWYDPEPTSVEYLRTLEVEDFLGGKNDLQSI